ncbi:MAG: hypothetical protein AAF720_15710 [Pseudomonadota bacterium]
MLQLSTVGVDLAKNVVQIHGVDGDGENPKGSSWFSETNAVTDMVLLTGS